jgi:hypothetical protein
VSRDTQSVTVIIVSVRPNCDSSDAEVQMSRVVRIDSDAEVQMSRVVRTLVFPLALVALGCQSTSTTSHKLGGAAQKGPFATGTQITVAELDKTLAPTGRIFSSTITSNSGTFSIPSVQLSSPYVKLTASGFYFDEFANALTVAPLTINAIADVTKESTVNVNLISALEGPRVETLIGMGVTFAQAKAQAESEVLGMFGITLNNAPPSETLDISGNSDADAALLAVSLMVLGHRSTAELSALVTDIAEDLKSDGSLSNASYGSALISGAIVMDMAAVRANLTQYYTSVGVTATLGNFEPYVSAFVAAAKYPYVSPIGYPDSGQAGVNVLAKSQTTLKPGHFGLHAQPPAGHTAKIGLTLKSGSSGAPSWAFAIGSCWRVSELVAGHQEISIPLAAASQDCDTDFLVFEAIAVQFDYYDDGATKPTFTKTVTFAP